MFLFMQIKKVIYNSTHPINLVAVTRVRAPLALSSVRQQNARRDRLFRLTGGEQQRWWQLLKMWWVLGVLPLTNITANGPFVICFTRRNDFDAGAAAADAASGQALTSGIANLPPLICCC